MATATGRRSSRRSSVERAASTVARTRSITGEACEGGDRPRRRRRAPAADASNGTATRSPVQSHDATSSKVAPARTASTTSQPAVGEPARRVEQRELGLDDHLEAAAPARRRRCRAASRSTSARRNRLRRVPGTGSLCDQAPAHVGVERLGLHPEAGRGRVGRHPLLSRARRHHTLMQSILTTCTCAAPMEPEDERPKEPR